MTPAVWVISSDQKYGVSFATKWPPFFTAQQQCRLERLRQSRMLFDGDHRTYFIDEDRSQYNFPFIRLSSGRLKRMYCTCNILKLISQKSADLLMGQEPLITCPDTIQQSKIEELKERTNLHAVFASAALECSYQAETLLESCVVNGQVYLRLLPTEEYFPIGEIQPDGQYQQYDRYQVTNVGTDKTPIWLLLITHVMPGQITRECWQLRSGDDGRPAEKLQQVDLKLWEPDPTLVPAQATGIAANTITWIPNLIQRGQPVSDYDGVIDLQDSVGAKNTQLARVLAKHADPKLGVPEYQYDDEGNMRADNDVLPMRTKDDLPAYITWEAQLDAAMKDRGFAVNQLLVQTETSPVLLGLKEGAAPDAYKKVRLEAFNSLTKAQRKSIYWRAGISRAVNVCLDLEASLPGNRFDRSKLSVQLRDGIPIDADEQAQTQSTLKSAGLISVEGAVSERLAGDAPAIALELSRIKKDASDAVPSVLLQPGSEPGSEPPIDRSGAGDDAATGADEYAAADATSGGAA